MTCKNVAELRKQIQKRIDDALAKEVADKILETVDKHIESDVYDKYTPIYYNRRFDNNGLKSGNVANTSTGLLVVKNIATSNSHISDPPHISRNAYKPLAPMVEYGGKSNFDYGFSEDGWHGDDYDPFAPRPFMHNSYDDIITYGYHIDALKRGLIRQGLKVK